METILEKSDTPYTIQKGKTSCLRTILIFSYKGYCLGLDILTKERKLISFNLIFAKY